MSTAIFDRTEPSVAEKFRAQQQLLTQESEILHTQHRVFLGDAREMSEIGDSQVHLIVTSPPYWTLKTYQDSAGEAQLGHTKNYREFLASLNRTWERCRDALVPGGRLCIVVGDVCLPRGKTGRHYVVPLHADI